jgi:hypothetical protein
VEALDTALSIEVWERLRKDRGLSLKAARRVVDKLVTGLIGGVP